MTGLADPSVLDLSMKVQKNSPQMRMAERVTKGMPSPLLMPPPISTNPLYPKCTKIGEKPVSSKKNVTNVQKSSKLGDKFVVVSPQKGEMDFNKGIPNDGSVPVLVVDKNGVTDKQISVEKKIPLFSSRK